MTSLHEIMHHHAALQTRVDAALVGVRTALNKAESWEVLEAVFIMSVTSD